MNVEDVRFNTRVIVILRVETKKLRRVLKHLSFQINIQYKPVLLISKLLYQFRAILGWLKGITWVGQSSITSVAKHF